MIKISKYGSSLSVRNLSPAFHYAWSANDDVITKREYTFKNYAILD